MGPLTLLELRHGASLDRNRLLNLTAWGIKIAAALALLRFVSISPSFSLVDGRDLPWPLAVIAFFLVVDLGEYLFHRAQHAIPLLWALHSLHHSDPDIRSIRSCVRRRVTSPSSLPRCGRAPH
jgi:sterol desaturase/sphingolipid hydroxylase (fatty acid hydroxylase superfamily)